IFEKLAGLGVGRHLTGHRAEPLGAPELALLGTAQQIGVRRASPESERKARGKLGWNESRNRSGVADLDAEEEARRGEQRFNDELETIVIVARGRDRLGGQRRNFLRVERSAVGEPSERSDELIETVG